MNTRISSNLLALFLFGWLFSACQTTDKGVAVVVVSADNAMQAWAKYVVATRANPAADQQELARQETVVRRVYGNYQAACDAYDAVRTLRKAGKIVDSEQARQSVEAAAKTLIDLITRLAK